MSTAPRVPACAVGESQERAGSAVPEPADLPAALTAELRRLLAEMLVADYLADSKRPRAIYGDGTVGDAGRQEGDE